MKHYGDITQINGYNVPLVDIVTGGSPCQDLSVAGKRAGLDGERSGLFMEQIRIIKEMRDYDRANKGTDVDVRPRYMVWENVPGAFSSNKGEDFRCVLEETAKIACKNATIPRPEEGRWEKTGCVLGDGWSIAWRVHDAQFWGVPQRRKRICLLADFDGDTAPKILFELFRETIDGDTDKTIMDFGEESESKIQLVSKGLSRDFEQSRKETKRTTTSSERNSIETISFQERAGCEGGVRVSLSKESEQERCQPSIINPSYQSNEPILLESNQNHATVQTNGVSTSLPASMGMGGGYVPMVLMDAYQHHGYRESYTCGTLTADQNSGIRGDTPLVCYARQRSDELIESDVVSTQSARQYKDATDLVLTYGLDRASFNQGINAKYDFTIDEEKIATQVAKGPGAVASFYPQMKAESQCFRHDDISVTLVNGTNPGFQNGIITSVVRRLTPLECERLQGYPDGWTDIGDWIDSKGKKHKGEADAPRYKALGNSIALPFWEWMAQRIVEQYDKPTTMASLFDGIGGFPLVFSRCGCEPIWASEIEEFPIAVTKLRFPDKEDKDAN